MQSRQRQGFTLVELLVVIGIIATLIAILLPAMSKARQSANSLNCAARMREMGNGIALYTNANQGKLPYGYSPFYILNNSANGVNNAYSDWSMLITGALRGGSGYAADATFKAQTQAFRKKLFCDIDTIDGSTSELDYSAHPRLMPALGWGPATSSNSYDAMNGTQFPVYRISQVHRSSATVMVMDAVQILPGGAYANAKALLSNGTRLVRGFNPYYEKAPNNNVDVGINADSTGYVGSWGNIRWRHFGNKSANFLYVDGHVEAKRYTSQFKSDLTIQELLIDY